MTSSVRLLSGADAPEVRRLLQRDEVAYSVVAERLGVIGIGGAMGAEVWGRFEGGRLVAALYLGANVMPIEADEVASDAFASRARLSQRRCSSIVGPAASVLRFFDGVADTWGPAREVRTSQPMLSIAEDSPLLPDRRVRVAEESDLDLLFPAAVAMFTEELGISPLAPDGGGTYRRRVLTQIRQQRSFVLIEDDELVFKAEIGVKAGSVTQIQGVWVDPGHRGRGIAGPAMAQVVALSRRMYGPVVSLYVNDFNHAALAAYRRAGFQQVGEFATILF